MADLTPRRKPAVPTGDMKARRLELDREVLRVEKLRVEYSIMELQHQIENHYATIAGLEHQISDADDRLAQYNNVEPSESGQAETAG